MKCFRDKYDLARPSRFNAIVERADIITPKFFKPVPILTKRTDQFWIIAHGFKLRGCMTPWKLQRKATIDEAQPKPTQIASGWNHVAMQVIHMAFKTINRKVILAAMSEQTDFIVKPKLFEIINGFLKRDLFALERLIFLDSILHVSHERVKFFLCKC